MNMTHKGHDLLVYLVSYWFDWLNIINYTCLGVGAPLTKVTVLRVKCLIPGVILNLMISTKSKK